MIWKSFPLNFSSPIFSKSLARGRSYSPLAVDRASVNEYSKLLHWLIRLMTKYMKKSLSWNCTTVILPCFEENLLFILTEKTLIFLNIRKEILRLQRDIIGYTLVCPVSVSTYKLNVRQQVCACGNLVLYRDFIQILSFKICPPIPKIYVFANVLELSFAYCVD